MTDHKKLAAEANNRGWDLVEADRGPGEDLEMLHAVHAAQWHWARAGGPLETARAALLAAAAHAQLGHGTIALALAEEAQAGILPETPAPWERALVHGILAHAAHAAGDTLRHTEHLDEAGAAFAQITGDADREITAKTLRKVPGWPTD